VARQTLKELDRRLATAAGSATLNAYMTAHISKAEREYRKHSTQN